MTPSNITLISEFSKIKDPRLDRQKLHNLTDIFVITVCAVICGANTWNEIEQYGQSKHDWLKTFMELPNGIPSHDTFRRVFIIIDPEEFRTAFIDWVDSIRPLLPETVIAVTIEPLIKSVI